jgi:hypothetical protein
LSHAVYSKRVWFQLKEDLARFSLCAPAKLPYKATTGSREKAFHSVQ